MTVFYILMYHIFLEHYLVEENKKVTISLYILAFLRIAICLLPQNRWLSNESPLLFAILRNIPFLIMGVIICYLYFKVRNNTKIFKFIWLYIALSFAFYIPVTVGAGFIKILGALMLPKTVCYILIILAFLKFVLNNEKVEG